MRLGAKVDVRAGAMTDVRPGVMADEIVGDCARAGLRAAVPTLVDPGTTAIWEMRLDDVVLGKADYRAVIDEIAGEAERLIQVLRRHDGGKVDLGKPASFKAKARGKRAPKESGAMSCKMGVKPGAAKRKPRNGADAATTVARPANGHAKPPTEKMVAFAQRLAKDKKATLPAGYDKNFDVCRQFLDQHLQRSV